MPRHPLAVNPSLLEIDLTAPQLETTATNIMGADTVSVVTTGETVEVTVTRREPSLRNWLNVRENYVTSRRMRSCQTQKENSENFWTNPQTRKWLSVTLAIPRRRNRSIPKEILTTSHQMRDWYSLEGILPRSLQIHNKMRILTRIWNRRTRGTRECPQKYQIFY